MGFSAEFDTNLEARIKERLERNVKDYHSRKFIIHQGELRLPNGDGSYFVGDFQLYDKFLICET